MNWWSFLYGMLVMAVIAAALYRWQRRRFLGEILRMLKKEMAPPPGQESKTSVAKIIRSKKGEVEKKCAVCGKVFRITHHSRKYCGDECKRERDRERAKEDYHKNKKRKKERRVRRRLFEPGYKEKQSEYGKEYYKRVTKPKRQKEKTNAD